MIKIQFKIKYPNWDKLTGDWLSLTWLSGFFMPDWVFYFYK